MSTVKPLINRPGFEELIQKITHLNTTDLSDHHRAIVSRQVEMLNAIIDQTIELFDLVKRQDIEGKHLVEKQQS